MAAPEGYNRKEILYRIGTYFLLIGLGLLVFFLMSEAESLPNFNYFCWSIILLTLGFMFRAQYRKAVPPSGRFSIFKRFRRGNDE